MLRKFARINSSLRSFSTEKYTLPDLSYDYGALEPFINAEIMKIHHTKHHVAYITNLNIASEKLSDAVAKNDVTTIVSLQQNIKFNGGGHLNHSIFWKNLLPKSEGGGELPDSDLSKMIKTQYGSLEGLQTAISTASVGGLFMLIEIIWIYTYFIFIMLQIVQGSGWGWLGYDKAKKQLVVTTTANQDPLEATTGLIPIIGIDVWEHAYYLQVFYYFFNPVLSDVMTITLYSTKM